ncbi:hypothetical protein MRX96_000575 [Rhipicephalus microplus]
MSHVYISRNRLVEIQGKKRERMLRLCATDPGDVAVYCVVSADDADCTATEEPQDCCGVWLTSLHGAMVPGLTVFILVIISVVSFQIGKWGPPAEGDTLVAHIEETMTTVIAIACGLLFHGAYTFLFKFFIAVFTSPALIPH